MLTIVRRGLELEDSSVLKILCVLDGILGVEEIRKKDFPWKYYQTPFYLGVQPQSCLYLELIFYHLKNLNILFILKDASIFAELGGWVRVFTIRQTML